MLTGDYAQNLGCGGSGHPETRLAVSIYNRLLRGARMKFQFIALYNISGLSPDDEREPISLYSSSEGNSLAYLTSRPDTHCLLLDKSVAIALGILTALFNSSNEGSFEERLAVKIEEIRQERRKKYPSGVFLVFEGRGESSPFQADAKRDVGPFTLALDGTPKQAIRSTYQQSVSGIIATLAIAFDNFQGVCKISDGIIFFEDDGRPCFAFNVGMGTVNAFALRKAEASQIELSRTLAAEAQRDEALNSVFRLLIQSYDTEQDALRRFLAAWMALEVFINKDFPLYESEIRGEFASKLTVPMRDRYIRRITEVMQKEYNFLDRFVVVSGRLCSEDAVSDYEAVRPAHKLRNDFAHGTPIPEQGLPIATLQKVLRKLLMLHIERQRATRHPTD